ncbi:hypothetical protein BaRGS_00015024, partial [Batillaria attramentaria]
VVKRSSEDKYITVEVAYFMDRHYVEKMAHNYPSITTAQQLVDLSILKWSGIAAVLSGAERAVGWNIAVKLVRVEIWWENPEWYSPMTSDTLGMRMRSVCKGTHHLDVDHIMISTSLGLNHDKLIGCPKNSMGFMGNDMFLFLPCYRDRLDTYLRGKSCLHTESYNTSSFGSSSLSEHGLTLPLFPGQQYSFDSQCQTFYGKEFHYVQISTSYFDCWKMVCVASDVTRINYGQMWHHKWLMGSPCGHEKRGECASLGNETSADVNKIRQLAVDGGWGSWSEFSPCHGNFGVTVRVSSRKCNNPTPKYGAFCEGLEYSAELCPSNTSHERLQDRDIVPRIAEQVCSAVRDRWPGSHYSGKGRMAYHTGDLYSCQVRCYYASGEVSTDRYMAPDATPCNDYLDRFDREELGITFRCVTGKCRAFGCDGRTVETGGEKERDACGVCGGDGTSCIHGNLGKPIPPHSKRVALIILPVGATDMYVALPWNGASRSFIGLRCEHTCGLMCQNGATLDPVTCTCTCNERQKGGTCACRKPFGGPDCSGCGGVCENAGTVDMHDCTCH